MNSKELRAQMIRKDISAEDICAAIGISRSAWHRKINGESQFTQGEIMGIRRTLDLDDQMTGTIFFSEEVP